MAGKRRAKTRKRSQSGKKRATKPAKSRKRKRAPSRVSKPIPANPYSELTGEQIRQALVDIGAVFIPTDAGAKRYQTLLSGSNKLGTKKRLSLAERKELASERRRLLASKGEKPRKDLAKFHEQEVKLARRKRRSGKDIADRAGAILDKRGRANQMVFWIPNDRETGIYKKWQLFENFELFVRRPYYKEALAKELENGRFVIGTVDPETNTIREDSAGNPVIDYELGRMKK